MAIEAVLSLGLSLIVAIAAIGAFGSYRDSVIDTIEGRHAEVIKSRVLSSVYNLRDADSGSTVTVGIPEADGGYRIALSQENLLISSGGDEYSISINNVEWASDLSGSAVGPTVKIAKIGDGIVLRS